MTEVTAVQVQELLAKYLLVDVVPIIVDLERSYANRIVDARDGREWLDCFSYIASNAIGFNHPKMHESNFEKDLLRAARSKPANSDFYTKDMASFVSTFARVALPKEFKHLFFIEGGALAVENAMKIAFDWKVRKNLERGLSPSNATSILHFEQAFHGRSGYTLSVTNTADPRKTKYFPKFDWPRVPNPKVAFPLNDKNRASVQKAEAASVKAIEAAFKRNPNEIAAILLEPIQGEGGDNHFRPEFHQKLRAIADEHEALLIYDEVQTGLGLTGRMWAFENYGVVPDIVSFGKKTQVCGCMAGSRVDEVENNVFSEPSRINSTWGGSLVDMIRCKRILEIIEEEELLDNAKEVGEYFLQCLNKLESQRPDVISNVRGCGLFLAFDIASTQQRDWFFKECFLNGLLVLKAGLLTIRLRPSLTFSRQEVDEAMQVFVKIAGKMK